MKKLILSIAALALFATSAFAERYVMITHGEGKDPFWRPIQDRASIESLASSQKFGSAKQSDLVTFKISSKDAKPS